MNNNFNYYFKKTKLILKNYIDERESFSTILIDIDNFMAINMMYGYTFGDNVLKKVSNILINKTTADDIILRYYGDKFLIFNSTYKNESDIEDFIHNIKFELSKPFIIDEKKIYITSSIGITLYPNHSKTLDGLIECCEVALYSAKNNGRNCYKFFINDMHTEC